MVFNKEFYVQEYSKTGTYERLAALSNISDTESVSLAKSMTDNIFDFFNSKAGLKYFSEDEKSHMTDVKWNKRHENSLLYKCNNFHNIVLSIIPQNEEGSDRFSEEYLKDAPVRLNFCSCRISALVPCRCVCIRAILHNVPSDILSSRQLDFRG